MTKDKHILLTGHSINLSLSRCRGVRKNGRKRREWERREGRQGVVGQREGGEGRGGRIGDRSTDSVTFLSSRFIVARGPETGPEPRPNYSHLQHSCAANTG